MQNKTVLALFAASLGITACSDSGDVVGGKVGFYVTDGATLYVMSSDDSLNADAKSLTGLNAGTLMYSLDVNPRGGGLTGLGSDGQSYSINVSTGVATPAGAPDTSVSLNGKAVEIDYNPVVPNQQVYRVTTSTGENVRRNDTTGANVATDGSFVYSTGDVNAGKSVVVSGVAYTMSKLNTGVPASTTSYVLDSQNDVLATLGSNPSTGGACPGATGNPNCGFMNTVGPLGVDISGFVGFDILGDNTAYATAFQNGTYNLYQVNLGTGQMTYVAALNPKIVPVRAFAVIQR